MQRNEAIEIIKKIKDECSRADANCGGCIYHEIYGECPLVGNPETWDIQEGKTDAKFIQKKHVF